MQAKEKDAYYFSHDSNARNDPKIKALRKEYGNKGYGDYWIVVEMLREQENFKIPLKEYTYIALADEFNLSVEETKKFINDCIKKFELFDSDEKYFFSKSLTKRMKPLQKRRENAKKAANKRWSSESDYATAMQSQCDSNADAMQQQCETMKSKVKESKVKKNKEKEIKVNKIIFPFDSEKFKNTWNLWIEFRKENNWKKYKPIGMQMALKKLSELSEGDENTAIEIINQSIANNWRGFFQIKNKKNEKGFSQSARFAEKLKDAYRKDNNK